jgi:hypothetical protein
VGLFDWIRGRRPEAAPPPAGIELLEDRFVLHDGKGGRGAVLFADVHEIFAFQRPQGATRYLCLGIQVEYEGEPVVVDEGLRGFAEFREELLKRFKIDEGDVINRVARPSPGPNPTRLWRRRGDTFKR